jgi:hypothetical protein
MMTAEALVSLCLSLVVSTTLCQYNLILDSLTSFSNAFCSFLFLLKSCIFSCCLAFHCSTKDFSFFNFLIILCSSFTLSFSFLASTLNSGYSSTGEGRFRSIEAWGFLSLIIYFEDSPELRSSSSVLSESLVYGRSCSWSSSGKRSFLSSLTTFVPLNVDSDTEADFVVSLVTCLLEYCAIYFPFSRLFFCSSDSFSVLCKEDAKACFFDLLLRIL